LLKESMPAIHINYGERFNISRAAGWLAGTWEWLKGTAALSPQANKEGKKNAAGNRTNRLPAAKWPARTGPGGRGIAA
jgi:hypothetical protein